MQRMPLKNQRTSTQRGFTAMEIIVVTAIISLLATISLYAYNQSRPRLQLTSASTEIVGFLNKARITAIRMHREVRVSIENVEGGTVSAFNPDGVRQEFMIMTVTDAFGNDEELSSLVLPKSRPQVFSWGHDEDVIQGPSSNTFPGDELVFNATGTVEDMGAFRFSASNGDRTRNVLEVAFLSRAGSPIIRKFLASGDRPSGAPAQEFFPETIGSASGKNLWVWY
ncbi:MAG: prepilin-type N-terminal cleavage/methylation domain-containing protein [Acidobacteriota bacterium]